MKRVIPQSCVISPLKYPQWLSSFHKFEQFFFFSAGTFTKSKQDLIICSLQEIDCDEKNLIQAIQILSEIKNKTEVITMEIQT